MAYCFSGFSGVWEGVEEVTWTDVLVGYTTSSFVLANNKVCAALIQKPIVSSSRYFMETTYLPKYAYIVEQGATLNTFENVSLPLMYANIHKKFKFLARK